MKEKEKYCLEKQMLGRKALTFLQYPQAQF